MHVDSFSDVTHLPHVFGDKNNESSGQESDREVILSSIGASKPYKLSFQFVAEKASNLIHLAQSDPTTFGSLCNLLDQLTNILCNSQSILVQSYNTSVPSRMKNPGAMPLLGTLKAAPTCLPNDARYQDMSPADKLSPRPEILCFLSLDSPTIWLSYQNHAQGGNVVQFASVADINGGPALKSISSKSHHLT
jgi:hypothetical protein